MAGRMFPPPFPPQGGMPQPQQPGYGYPGFPPQGMMPPPAAGIPPQTQ